MFINASLRLRLLLGVSVQSSTISDYKATLRVRSV